MSGMGMLTSAQYIPESKKPYHQDKSYTSRPSDFAQGIFWLDWRARRITSMMADLLPLSSLCLSFSLLQGSAKRLRPGLVNFAPAVAYHFCLNLAEKFSQPGDPSFGRSFNKTFFPRPHTVLPGRGPPAVRGQVAPLPLCVRLPAGLLPDPGGWGGGGRERGQRWNSDRIETP